MAITNTALATAISDLIAHWQDFQDEHQAWLTGEVGGGPNLDGKYPLTDYEDVTILVTCPAQLEDDVESLVTGAQGYADDAAASATAAAASATTASTQATNAATSASNASTSATNASNSASAAASSATTASGQATAAAASATAAETAETNAETAETNAETAETNAETAASAAATSAAEAAASAAAAATFNPALYAALADNETVTGAYTFSAQSTFNKTRASQNQYAALLSAASPWLGIIQTGATANEGHWLLGALSDQFRIYALSDDEVTTNIAMAIDRSGAAVSEIEFNATLFDLNGNADISGTLIVGGAATMASNSLVEGGGGNSSSLYLQHNANASSGLLFQTDSSNHAYIWNYENASLVLATNNAAQLTIASTGAISMTGNLTVEGGTLVNSAALPIWRTSVTGSGSNEKHWLQYGSGTSLIIATATDASPGAAAATFVNFSRTGTTPVRAAFNAPVNVVTIAGDPASPSNGDIWYNSSTGKIRARANGASVDLH